MRRSQVDSTEQQIAAARERADEQIAAARERATEQIAAARIEQENARRQFQALAGDALDANSKRFLELAEERLKRSTSDGEQALAKREAAVKSLVDPLTKAVELVRSEVLLAENECDEIQGYFLGKPLDGDALRRFVHGTRPVVQRARRMGA